MTEYGVTPTGEALRPAMFAMAEWGGKTLETQIEEE
jgi:DNA-binding HxlR family transcriptional regulator